MAVVIREILVHLLLATLLGAGIGWALRGLRSRRLHADAAAASRRTLEELKARLNVSESARESVVAELQSSAEAARRQLADLQRDVQEMQAARDAALSERNGARTEVSKLTAQLEATARARTAAQAELDAARAALDETRPRLAAAEAEAARARGDGTPAASAASAHDEAVQQRLDTMRATLRAAEGGWDTARAQAEAALQQLAVARRQLTESDSERDVVAARLADVQGQLAVVRAQRDAPPPVLAASSTPPPPQSPTPVRDDLQRIRGIGPVLERTLHRAGVYCYAQIATWTPEDIRLMSARLPGVQKRIVRDRWATAARRLHLEKYGSAPERSS